jgi:hypothetical protein
MVPVIPQVLDSFRGSHFVERGKKNCWLENKKITGRDLGLNF